MIIAAVAMKKLTFSYDLVSVCAPSTILHKYEIST